MPSQDNNNYLATDPARSCYEHPFPRPVTAAYTVLLVSHFPLVLSLLEHCQRVLHMLCLHGLLYGLLGSSET